jgi:hypothetical protein
LLDRTGDGLITSYDGMVSVLIDTTGLGQPDFAVELDREGRLVSHTALTVYADPDGDDLDDLGPEVTFEGEPVLEALGDGALLGRRCRCDKPWLDGGDNCGRCGCPGARHAGGRLLTVC